MKVLVVGRGGREHAICWTLHHAPSVTEVICAPGNAGIESIARTIDVPETDLDALVAFAKEEEVALTIVGPEQPLSEGIVDAFTEAGLLAFGPTKAAAAIEGSKSFAKDLMKKYAIPTAFYDVFQDAEAAKAYIEKHGAPIVIKADGLAAGKGVVVAMTKEEAFNAVEDMLVHGQFGDSSRQIVIEEYLEGEEFSFMSLVHGDVIIPLEIAQDHKRAYDGDKGPNTGGMGAYSPVPHIADDVVREAYRTIVEPTVDAMKAEGTPFTGVLYAGLMLTDDGPKVIEFNARFGDPETQVVLPRLQTDLAQLILALLNGQKTEPVWTTEAMVGVVLASDGYPGSYAKEIPLPAFEDGTAEQMIFHAGTRRVEGHLVSDGGRVLVAAEKGTTIEEAQQKAYAVLGQRKTEGFFYRTDIGYRAIAAEQKK